MELAPPTTARPRYSIRSLACWSVLGLAAGVTAALWLLTKSPIPAGPLGPLLVGALMLSNYVSLPVGGKARIWFFNIPAFLIVALFAPPLAMALVGIGMGAKEILICRRCRNTAAMVAGQTGRWMLLALAGSALAHSGDVLITGMFLCPLLWLGDVVTAPLVVSFGSIYATVKRLLGHTWEDELMQYVSAYFLLPFFVLYDGQRLLIGLSLILNLCWLGLYIMIRRAAMDISTEQTLHM